MSDYRARLADQLRAAAEEHLNVPAANAEAAPSRRRGRRFVVGGLLAAALVTPAALAASGVIGGETEKGGFTDGSTFTVSTVPDPRGASAGPAGGESVCERVEFRDAEGKLTAVSNACGPSHGNARASSRLGVGFQTAPARTVLLRGTAPDGTASIEVTDSIGPVSFDEENRRFVAQIARDAPMRVIARSAEGRALDTFERPAMEP